MSRQYGRWCSNSLEHTRSLRYSSIVEERQGTGVDDPGSYNFLSTHECRVQSTNSHPFAMISSLHNVLTEAAF